MKTGIVDVGGGLRGVYAAGVFDYCMDNDIWFDVGIGVSAGSANVASYVAKQRGRNYPFYTEYSFRKEYMSLNNFLHKKSYLDLNYIYGTLSNSDGENPLDYKTFAENPTEFIAVATDATTGKVKYFDKNDVHQDDYKVLMASCAIPLVCHPYEVNDVPYYDGALGDSVPVEKAFKCGCDKVVLILTKPKDYIRESKNDEKIVKAIQRKYPKAAEQLRLRAAKYNQSVAIAKKYEAQGRVCIIAPDDTCGVDTLTKDKEALKRFYEKGYRDAEVIREFLHT